MGKTILTRFIKAAVFLLIFFFLLFGISYILRPVITVEENNEKLNLLGYYAEPENTIDVLYFGSSDATVYWMPFEAYKQAGFTSYTYGKSMMRASMFEDLLNEALKYQKPQLAVISLRTILDSSDTVEETALRSVTDSLPYTSPNRWKMISRNRGKIVLTSNSVENGGTGEPDTGLFSLLPFYFDIWKYHDNWQYVWKDSFNFGRIGEFTSNTKGFLLRTWRIPQTREAVDFSDTATLPISESAETALRNMMKTAGEKGIDLLFVMSPYCESSEDRMRYNTAAALIRESGYKSVDFNEFYAEIGINDRTDYYDSRHLNTIGAAKYTDYFIQYLKENYDLPDHRGDERWSFWQEGIPDWETIKSDAFDACRGIKRSEKLSPGT